MDKFCGLGKLYSNVVSGDYLTGPRRNGMIKNYNTFYCPSQGGIQAADSDSYTWGKNGDNIRITYSAINAYILNNDGMIATYKLNKYLKRSISGSGRLADLGADNMPLVYDRYTSANTVLKGFHNVDLKGGRSSFNTLYPDGHVSPNVATFAETTVRDYFQVMISKWRGLPLWN